MLTIAGKSFKLLHQSYAAGGVGGGGGGVHGKDGAHSFPVEKFFSWLCAGFMNLLF